MRCPLDRTKQDSIWFQIPHRCPCFPTKHLGQLVPGTHLALLSFCPRTLTLALKKPQGTQKLTKPGGGRAVESESLRDLAGRTRGSAFTEVAHLQASTASSFFPHMQWVRLWGACCVSSRLRNGSMCACLLASPVQPLAPQQLEFSYVDYAYLNLGQQCQVIRQGPVGTLRKAQAALTANISMVFTLRQAEL